MAFANEYREQHAKKIIMNVGASAFDQLESGQKTLEMRIKKEGRTRISAGDIIIFKLQTGEEQKAEDEVSCEKKVLEVRTYLGISAVLKKEDPGKILPGRPNKKEFLAKALQHYKKAANGIDIERCEFEVIELA